MQEYFVTNKLGETSCNGTYKPASIFIVIVSVKDLEIQ